MDKKAYLHGYLYKEGKDYPKDVYLMGRPEPKTDSDKINEGLGGWQKTEQPEQPTVQTQQTPSANQQQVMTAALRKQQPVERRYSHILPSYEGSSANADPFVKPEAKPAPLTAQQKTQMMKARLADVGGAEGGEAYRGTQRRAVYTDPDVYREGNPATYNTRESISGVNPRTGRTYRINTTVGKAGTDTPQYAAAVQRAKNEWDAGQNLQTTSAIPKQNAMYQSALAYRNKLMGNGAQDTSRQANLAHKIMGKDYMALAARQAVARGQQPQQVQQTAAAESAPKDTLLAKGT